MFKYDKVMDVLSDFRHLSTKRQRKFMTALLFDDDFIKWLFQPDKDPNLAEKVEKFYAELIKSETIMSMIDAIEYEGYHEFTRSHATFFSTVANIAIQYGNDTLEDLEEGRKNGDYSRKEIRDFVDDIDELNDNIAKLLKRTRRIVKRDATILAKRTRLPKYITMTAFLSVPEPKYIDRYKIGYYLNNLFNTIYSDVEENGEFDSSVRWKEFFREIFGKNNVIEAAMFILLEGVHRIDKYNNQSDVKACWDSLTNFALNELNDAPEQIRNQMMELYIKRVDKMFATKVFDLRVNLLKLDDIFYPKLAKTIEKYADKIKAILDR